MGLDDPMMFSSGISLALVTTVVGLVVAIPHYIFYNYFVLNNLTFATLKRGLLDNGQ